MSRTLEVASSWLASTSRLFSGVYVPAQRLELYSVENSPYCRLARSTLCELELPYLLHNVGKRSPSRAAFIARSGKMQVPWLFDPNTQVGMFESADIQAYLLKTSGAGA